MTKKHVYDEHITAQRAMTIGVEWNHPHDRHSWGEMSWIEFTDWLKVNNSVIRLLLFMWYFAS